MMLSLKPRILASIKPRNISRAARLLYSTEATIGSQNQYNLTCGLEIHAQLQTKQKLFSTSNNIFNSPPNSQVSYYDAALPGTQPILNTKNVYLALKAAVALDCKVSDSFTFDRKHYFYGDQPAGYQITQHFEPYAQDGILELFPRDGVKKPVKIRIKQIQIEQDTGKSTYIDDTANIDLNRTNTCLIELVTEPDIPDPETAGIFVKKLQMLLKHLQVCSGELESGAMRVDVNVSVNYGQRCEIKNLSSTSAIVHAIKAEFKRQKKDLQNGKKIESETRGWDGKNTWKLRGKEEGVDYRYMPDPEVLPVDLEPGLVDVVRQTLPELPDEIFKNLLVAPYSVPLKDARSLMATYGGVDYYKAVFDYVKERGGKTKTVSNWIVHNLLGELNVQDKEFDPSIISVKNIGDIIVKISDGSITTASGKLIFKHYLHNEGEQQSVEELIEQFDLGKAESGTDGVQEAITSLCQEVIDKFPDITESIKSGKKPKSIQFLIGNVMRGCQGRVDPKTIEEVLKSLINK